MHYLFDVYVVSIYLPFSLSMPAPYPFPSLSPLFLFLSFPLLSFPFLSPLLSPRPIPCIPHSAPSTPSISAHSIKIRCRPAQHPYPATGTLIPTIPSNINPRRTPPSLDPSHQLPRRTPPFCPQLLSRHSNPLSNHRRRIRPVSP